MPYHEDAQSLIAAIKAKVHLLEWQEDWLLLDKECAEIDLLMYKLRQLVLQPTPAPKIDWMAELEKELENDGIQETYHASTPKGG